MLTKQQPELLPEIQMAIYGVALSLDSLLVNDIPNGVIHQHIFDDILPRITGSLLKELASVEEFALDTPFANESRARELLARLRTKCQQLIDLVIGLNSFRTYSLDRLRSTVAEIKPLRDECVQLIQELERCFRTPKPFYLSRSSHSTTSVNDFIANLGRMFEDEWVAARTA